MNGTAVEMSTDWDDLALIPEFPNRRPKTVSTFLIMKPPSTPRIVSVTLDSTETKKRDGNIRVMNAIIDHRTNRPGPTRRDSMYDNFSPESANADGPMGRVIIEKTRKFTVDKKNSGTTSS